MTGQLQLVEVAAEPRLTSRQQAVLDAVQHAGIDGLDTDHAGAILHARTGKHDTDARCRFCGRDGKSVLAGELRPKGLVRYRRGTASMPGGWVAIPDVPGTTRNDPEPPDHDGAGPVPYNAFPAGF